MGLCKFARSGHFCTDRFNPTHACCSGNLAYSRSAAITPPFPPLTVHRRRLILFKGLNHCRGSSQILFSSLRLIDRHFNFSYFVRYSSIFYYRQITLGFHTPHHIHHVTTVNMLARTFRKVIFRGRGKVLNKRIFTFFIPYGLAQ
jgi:hypothetical protein